jgi:hypothetical protein
MSFFYLSFAKLENGRAEQVLPGEADTSGREEEVEKGCRKVNMVLILCTHLCKWKKDSY